MRAYRRVHTTKQGNTRADVYMCENAPDLGFRIHLTRTIDHECTSDRADLLKKSSYLHSPRIVGFRIKRRATGVAPVAVFLVAANPAKYVVQIYWKCTRWLQRIAAKLFSCEEIRVPTFVLERIKIEHIVGQNR